MPILSENRQAPPATTGREHPGAAGGPAPCAAGVGIPSRPHLRGLHRASLCCDAEVVSGWRRCDGVLEDAVVCTGCGRWVEIHAVLNSDGDRVWPVPEWFVVPSAAAPTPPIADPEAWPEPFAVRLPAHLKRTRLHIPR